MKDYQLDTLTVHGGYTPEEFSGAVNPPIYATSTYLQDGVGGLRNGYEYSRTGNPTRKVLEDLIAELEKAQYGLAFSSGLAAEDAILRSLLKPGDEVIMSNDVYGGTFRLIDKVLQAGGIKNTPIDLMDLDLLQDSITPSTKLIWLETPTNPLLNIFDISEIAKIAHSKGIILVVDNTFATPYLQNPLVLGADIVIHSATKYLGGHSDTIGGVVVTNNKKYAENIAFLQNSVGATLSPFDSYLIIRGIRTLAVRMDKHCANAEKIIGFLAEHPQVGKVYYPGITDSPAYAVAKKQMDKFGGMVSFQIAGGREQARNFCGNTKLFYLAESLGGVESLIEYPFAMTHASTAGSTLEVPDNLIRLSVGIECATDLINDLEQAF